MFSRSNLMLPKTFLPMLAQATSRKNMTNSLELVGLLVLEKLIGEESGLSPAFRVDILKKQEG